MTLERARILKAPKDARALGEAKTREVAQRMPRVVVSAHEEAARILAAARANAEAIEREARDSARTRADEAVQEAREIEIARVSAELLHARIALENRLERELERTTEVARLVAERIVGEAILVEPERIAAIAHAALEETRGARQIRIEACADDVAALRALLPSHAVTIEVNAALGRGSLVVHTELGRIDARLEPQVERLVEALREALRG